MSRIFFVLTYLFMLWYIAWPHEHEVSPDLQAAAVRLIHSEMTR